MDPTPIGYHGTATNTNELSPQWVSGLATAWTIPLDDDSRAPLLIAEGTTLYAVLVGTQDDRASLSLYQRRSGARPHHHRDPAPDRRHHRRQGERRPEPGALGSRPAHRGR